MKVTVGVDLSLTHTGIVILGEDKLVYHRGVIKSKPTGASALEETKRIVTIAEKVVQAIDATCPTTPPDLVVIEGLAFMAQGTSLVQLAGLNYLTRILLAQFEWPFLIVAPTTLKKFITGSGRGDKDMMMMETFKNYDFSAMDNNECDAYGLAAVGLAALGAPLKPLLKPQQEVIKLLKKQI